MALNTDGAYFIDQEEHPDLAQCVRNATPQWIAEILGWFKQHGLNVENAAKHFNVDVDVVRKYVDQTGVNLPKYDPQNNVQKKMRTYNSEQNGVYVLALDDDKFYVGMSQTLQSRIHQHFTGGGTAWTEAHDPQRIIGVELHPDECIEYIQGRENSITLNMMQKHGWRAVRGGSWYEPQLDEPPAPIRVLNCL